MPTINPELTRWCVDNLESLREHAGKTIAIHATRGVVAVFASTREAYKDGRPAAFIEADQEGAALILAEVPISAKEPGQFKIEPIALSAKALVEPGWVESGCS